MFINFKYCWGRQLHVMAVIAWLGVVLSPCLQTEATTDRSQPGAAAREPVPDEHVSGRRAAMADDAQRPLCRRLYSFRRSAHAC